MKTKITLLPPTPSISKTYHPTLRSCIQPCLAASSPNDLPPTPQTFLDAMTIREAVFVDEQKVPLENEFDEEDGRCWHWVLYAEEASSDGKDDGQQDGEAAMKPVGTIRLVPFPQQGEQPRDGGVYWGGELVNAEELGAAKPQGHQDEEPFLTFGRLAVLRSHRGRGLARQLISAAVQFAAEHPTSFNVSRPEGDLTWKGLICCHAQTTAMGMWARNGFEVDKSLGKWFEEGMEHVGMFRRCEVPRQ